MSALLLRIIACLAMLVDHIGYDLQSMPMRAVGRIAFPIFVYLIYNGYKHTSNRLGYALRLAIFAAISQIPFSLFCTDTFTYLNGNVFLTLLMALLCIWAADTLRHDRVGRWFCVLPAIFVCALYQLGYLRSDYGSKGVVIAMIFLFLDGKETWKRILMTLACLCAVFYNHAATAAILLLRGRGLQIPAVSQWDWMQLYSLLSLPLIFTYSGKKGATPKNPILARITQYGFYLFYPVHMLLLWLLRHI